jgi:Spy/CpxP family protein refolding chaperone
MQKKYFLVTALVLAAAAGLSAAVTQVSGAGAAGPHGGRKLERMTRELNLTDAQQAQIKTILQTEQAKTQPLRQQLRQNRLAQPSNPTGTFDEAQVRAYAAKQAQIRSDLTVERERAKAQIYRVLTPEQRDKAQALLEKHREHRMHKHSQFPGNTTPG